jgi:hypothetical protein
MEIQLNYVQQATLAYINACRESSMKISEAVHVKANEDSSYSPIEFNASDMAAFRVIGLRAHQRAGMSVFQEWFCCEESKKLELEQSSERILWITSDENDFPIHSRVDYYRVRQPAEYGRLCQSLKKADFRKYRWVIVDQHTWICGHDIHLEKLISAVYDGNNTKQFFLTFTS